LLGGSAVLHVAAGEYAGDFGEDVFCVIR